jgi:transposase
MAMMYSGGSRAVVASSRGLGSGAGSAAPAFMSAKEINRLRVVQLVLERRMTRVKAGGLLGIGARQLIRLCGAYKRDGAAGLVSRKRGRVGNRKLPPAVEAQVVELSRRLYRHMGPTFVRDRLAERHGIKLAKETVRKILSRAGLWAASRGHDPKRRSPMRVRSNASGRAGSTRGGGVLTAAMRAD